MSIRVLRVAAALSALAAAGFASTAVASTPLRPEARGMAAQDQPLRVRLRVSDRKPRQLQGVLFNASASPGDIAVYVFEYGDGVIEESYQPLASHGYRRMGTYHARVDVIDKAGHKATSARVTIRVRDGTPPVVRIDSPRPGQRLRLGAGGLLFTGRATDRNGVRRVDLAIQLVASARIIKTPPGDCIWYDGRHSLVLTRCSTPYFFPAHFAGGHWRFRSNPRARLPRGRYTVRAVAIDHAGNVSHFFTVALRTILPFKLVG